MDWKNPVTGVIGVAGNFLMTSAEMRDEVTAWVSLVCTLVITCVTCIIQVVRAMRDINKDKKNEPFEMPEGSYEDDYSTGEKEDEEIKKGGENDNGAV